jgi:selenophosphate synthetase-related protein
VEIENWRKLTVSNPVAVAKSAYAAAGVNIDNKMDALKAIKTMVGSTKTVNVVGGIGSFGGLCRLPQGSPKDTILVSSTDGVGTKLKVAAMMKKHDTVGQDIVNHCVNDILVQGARPLFFMDYVGTSKFDGPIFRQIVAGLCKACKENNMALLGGETAEGGGEVPVLYNAHIVNGAIRDPWGKPYQYMVRPAGDITSKAKNKFYTSYYLPNFYRLSDDERKYGGGE